MPTVAEDEYERLVQDRPRVTKEPRGFREPTDDIERPERARGLLNRRLPRQTTFGLAS